VEKIIEKNEKKRSVENIFPSVFKGNEVFLQSIIRNGSMAAFFLKYLSQTSRNVVELIILHEVNSKLLLLNLEKDTIVVYICILSTCTRRFTLSRE
jgi:hypothetical protein